MFQIALFLLLLLPSAVFAQEGSVLGEEVVQEYNKDTTNPDLVKDINRLLDSLKNENQLSPETKEILEQIPPDALKSDKRSLQPMQDVGIERGKQKPSVFKGIERQDQNANRRGDVAFEVQDKIPEDSVPEYLDNAYRAMEAGQLEAAAMLYKRVIYADPENKDALFGLASVYQRTGQLPQAEQPIPSCLVLTQKIGLQ